MAASDVLQVNQHFLSKPPEESDAFGITQQKPKFPQYAVVSKRMESYKNWPEYLPLTPDALVEAGLVYTGMNIKLTDLLKTDRHFGPCEKVWTGPVEK